MAQLLAQKNQATKVSQTFRWGLVTEIEFISKECRRRSCNAPKIIHDTSWNNHLYSE